MKSHSFFDASSSFRAISIVTLLSIQTVCGAEPSKKSSEFEKEIELKTGYADDFSEVSAGIGWDLKWNRSFSATQQPAETGKGYLDTSIQLEARTKGTLLLNEDLNNDPITGSFRGFYFSKWQSPPGGGISAEDRNDPFGSESGASRPSTTEVVQDGRSIGDFLAFGAGLDAGFETDQAFENGAFRLSAFALMFNEYHLRQIKLKSAADWGLVLLPTLEIAFDGLHRTASSSTTTGAESNDEYARFRSVASWRYYVGQHFLDTESPLKVFDSLELYGAVQYSQDFDQNSGWKAAGQDQSLGWLVELTYDLGLVPPRGAVLFAQFSGGRIAPILEDDKTFLIGVRYRF